MIKMLPLAFAAWLALAPAANAYELERIFFQNEQEKVEREARERLRGTKEDPFASAWLAEALMKQGKWDEAREALREAGTDSLVGVLAHGDFAWYTGNFAGALSHFQAAMAKEPADPHAQWGVASALLHLDRFDEALAIARALDARSAQLDPDFRAWVKVVIGGSLGLKAERGNMFDKLRSAGEVKSTFEQALAISPKNPNVLSSLGRFYLLAPPLMGDKGRAVELLRRADDLDPFFYLNDAYLIRALIANGQADKAKVEVAMYRAKYEGLDAPMVELARLKL
jgi:tetratricopeptide (TPR) repeat protein